MKIIYVPKSKTKELRDVTDLVASFTLSVRQTEIATCLEISAFKGAIDSFVPSIQFKVGDAIVIADGDKEIFRGNIWFKDVSSGNALVSLTCFDKLIYLQKSEPARCIFTNETPEQITFKICRELGVTPGTQAKTGLKCIVNGRRKTGYDIIMQAYTLAKNKTGKRYLLKLNNSRAEVVEQGKQIEGLILSYKEEAVPGAILGDISYSESIENMVNRIVIVGEDGKNKGRKQSLPKILEYGLVQKTVDEGDGASTLMLDKELTIQMTVVGDMRLDVGRAVAVDTQIIKSNRLYITEVSHHFEGGIHTSQLVLSTKNEMDEREADNEG